MKDFLRSLWDGLLAKLGLQNPSPRIYEYEDELLQAVKDLAIQEERPEEAVAAELVSLALIKKDAHEVKVHYWDLLSYREQQVVALTCLNYTNRQIAAQLRISPTTVAAHMRNILRKFNLHSKAELRQMLAYWDFSSWKDVR